jgi:hypothetical protein
MGIFKKIDGHNGRIIETYVDETGSKCAYIAEAEPRGDSVYLGNLICRIFSNI